jgi:putative DNA primase/helicase
MKTTAYIPSGPFEARAEAPGAKPNGVAAQPESEEDREIARLAQLGAIDYDRERKVAAGQLGVRVSTLDKSVAAERPADESKVGQGRPLELPEPEPWPAPVDGVALVAELTAAIRKYVVLSERDALAAALWVLHTYCFDAFACTPRLAVTSPEKRCGETTLLDVIGLLVPRPLSTANISAAATFRTIETARPTLLVDEADTFLSENEELRGILNSGHRSGGQVIRTVGDDFEARAFSTHCPVAIAQIGKLPDTLADRSVHISMKRRAPGETISRFQHGRTPELIEAASKAARWTTDNAEAIRECEPVIPDAIFNRAADNWAPLLAIAEVIGAGIAEQARQAALAASGVEEELSPRAALLADIREVFAENDGGRMSSADLVAALVAMADRPWGECNHGKPLTQNGLARRLKGFGISPKHVGPKNNRINGYELIAFKDAFSRYLPNPPLQSSHLHPTNEINALGENQSSHQKIGCEVLNSSNQLNLKEVCGCEVQNPESGARDENGANGTVPTGSKKVADRGYKTAMHPAVDDWGLGDS